MFAPRPLLQFYYGWMLPRHRNGWWQEPEGPASLTGNGLQWSIDASDNLTLQLTHSMPYRMRILGALLRTNSYLHHKIIDYRAKRVAQLVRKSLGHCPTHISSWPGQAPFRICNSRLQLLIQVEGKNRSALYHSAKPPPYNYSRIEFKTLRKQ